MCSGVLRGENFSFFLLLLVSSFENLGDAFEFGKSLKCKTFRVGVVLISGSSSMVDKAENTVQNGFGYHDGEIGPFVS